MRRWRPSALPSTLSRRPLLWIVAAATLAASAVVALNPMLAGAVPQDLKNGCTSEATYTGRLSSPTFDTSSGGDVTFQGWFEGESIDPDGHDLPTVVFSTPDDGDLDPIQLKDLSSVPNSGGSSEVGYSNLGTKVKPDFQPYTVPIPAEALNLTDVQVHFAFDSGDGLFNGFRGFAVDDIAIDTSSTPLLQTFESGASGWNFEAPSSPGAPAWHILNNPQNTSIANPAINPDLVTLDPSDDGSLPAASEGTAVAWFGDDASGTFCGPGFADRQEPDPPFTDTGTTETTPPPPPGPLTLADLPNPTLGVDFNAETKSGTVLVGIPSGASAADAGRARASQKGITFVPLEEARQIPIGSFVDTTKGTAAIQSARDATGLRQTGAFSSGLFQVIQSRKRSSKGLTDLRMKGSSFKSCATGGKKKGGKKKRGKSRARGAGVEAGSSRGRTIRRLRGNADGRFRTRGRHSAATVRGTIWDVTDRCDGTLTKVKRGTVAVFDFRRKKTIVVKAGKSYLAKAKAPKKKSGRKGANRKRKRAGT